MSSKVLRKLSMQLQTGATYESNAAMLMPFADGIFNQGFDAIEDDSILGVGFQNTPLQGLRHVGGSYDLNLDPISIIPLLYATVGNNSSTAYYFDGSHSKKLSICELNAVNAIKYTSCYVKSLKISGSKGGLIKVNTDIFSIVTQNRDVVGNFPSVTNPGTPFSFQEAGGTNGYFRIGGHGGALSSSNDTRIESFNLEITSGFDESFANENDQSTPDALGSLIPTWGMTPPSVKFSFKIPKYLVETLQTAQDASTAQQAELMIYKSATSTFKIQIPNCKLKVDLTSEDLTGMNVDLLIGRNGISTSYVNSYMAFNSPVYFTVVNS